jgi:hypothetical protein
MSAPFDTYIYDDPKVKFTRYNPETSNPPINAQQPPMEPIVHAPTPCYTQLGRLPPVTAYTQEYIKSQWLRTQNSYR